MFLIFLDSNNTIIRKSVLNEIPDNSEDEQMLRLDYDTYGKISVGWKVDIEKSSDYSLILDSDYIIDRIQILKNELRNTDWIVVEILEHHLFGNKDPKENPPHDIDEIYKTRQAWRSEIRELESFKN